MKSCRLKLWKRVTLHNLPRACTAKSYLYAADDLLSILNSGTHHLGTLESCFSSQVASHLQSDLAPIGYGSLSDTKANLTGVLFPNRASCTMRTARVVLETLTKVKGKIILMTDSPEFRATVWGIWTWTPGHVFAHVLNSLCESFVFSHSGNSFHRCRSSQPSIAP